MYHNPAFEVPTTDELKKISSNLGFNIAEDDLKDYQDAMAGFAHDCEAGEKYSEPTLPVKYPRTPGYRPSGEENTHNAWSYKTDIAGATTGKLAGKTVVIKDSIPVAGVPMWNGCRAMVGFVPDQDATIVTRILDAGGRIVGKSTCEDCCFSGGSHTSACEPVLNPHDKNRHAGGSSSGSAALISLGEADLAVGADQGGSIRMPSCWCGTVGLKATYGLIPYTGIGSMFYALDHVGPMTKTVEDCALLLEVMAGYDDGLDGRQSRDVPLVADIPQYSKRVNESVAGLKVGILKEGIEGATVADIIRQRALELKTQDIAVEDVSIPMHKDGQNIWSMAALPGIYHNMVANPAVCIGPKGHYSTTMIVAVENNMATRFNMVSPTMKYLQMFGKYSAEKYGWRHVAKAQNLERVLRAAYDKQLETNDVLVMPTIKFTAPCFSSLEESTKGTLTSAFSMLANTAAFNLTGHPTITVNAGFSDGLPVGMMVVGRHFDEVTVLKVARAIERARDALE